MDPPEDFSRVSELWNRRGSDEGTDLDRGQTGLRQEIDETGADLHRERLRFVLEAVARADFVDRRPPGKRGPLERVVLRLGHCRDYPPRRRCEIR